MGEWSRPRPPHLAEAAATWDLREVFWLVRHGVKVSGMSACGPIQDDRTTWGIAAFVKDLPVIKPRRYAALGERAGGGSSTAAEETGTQGAAWSSAGQMQ